MRSAGRPKIEILNTLDLSAFLPKRNDPRGVFAKFFADAIASPSIGSGSASLARAVAGNPRRTTRTLPVNPSSTNAAAA